MDEMQYLGIVITALITLGSFIALIMKFVQPINELRVVIQKLNDRLDAKNEQDDTRDKRIDAHGAHLDNLDGRVGKLETKMNIYHKE